MTGRSPVPRRLRTIAALGLAAVVASSPGCGPASEGRPAGSIEVKNARTKASDVDEAKAKSKTIRARKR